MSNSNSTKKTKTILKNTIALYVRMAFTMIISLYTSRVVLQELGIDNYGLYNVVGGMVAVFGFMKTSMASSTQRFLSFEMGKGNIEKLRDTFSICLTSHVLIAIIFLFATETVGLWYVNSHLNVPEGSLYAANWLFQFSVFALFVDILSIPFSADIISNEKMGVFAVLGIFDATLKLAIAFLIAISPIDKIIFYAFLVMLVTILNAIVVWRYCNIKFMETHFRFYWDKEDLKRVFSFSGWTLWGQLAVVGANQGTNLVVNSFFSVAANAAVGIGQQVNNALSGLVYNFQSAFKPQITKSYAEGDFKYLNSLICASSKISFFLLFLVSLPVVANIDFILELWLDKVPDETSSFCVIYIMATLFDAISGPLWMGIFAAGNIKKYQMVISFTYLSQILIIYILYSLGISLVIGVGTKAFLNFIIIFIRVYYANKEMASFDVQKYIRNVIVPLAIVSVFVYAILILLDNNSHNLLYTIVYTTSALIFAVALTLIIGLNKEERNMILKTIRKH